MKSDALINATTRAVTAGDELARVTALKSLLALAWRSLPPSERRAFYGAVDTSTDRLDLIQWRPKWPDLKDLELEQAARVWPAILNSQDHGPNTGFCLSIAKQLKFPNWTPSDKQRDYMKRLFREWRRWRDESEQVLEDEA